MVVFTFACAVMFDRADWKLRAPLLVCWIWPSLSPFVVSFFLFPITPLIVLFAAARTAAPLLRRAPVSLAAAGGSGRS